MAKKAKVTDEQIDKAVTNLMRHEPVKFLQYCLVVIGRDIHQSGAKEFKFSTECNLEEARRFKVTIKGTIKELTNK